MTDLLREHGQAIVQALLNACLFSLPTYMQPESADVIHELMLIDRPVGYPLFLFWSKCILFNLVNHGSLNIKR